MSLFDFPDQSGRLRIILSKMGLLPRFMKRSGEDRRSNDDRRNRACDQYIITEGADRRFQPERRGYTERRAGTMNIDDIT